MKIGKKLLIPILSIGLLIAGNSEISYAAIESGNDLVREFKENKLKIQSPTYSNGNSPTEKDWEEALKKQVDTRKTLNEGNWREIEKNGLDNNAIYIDNMGKKIKIKKVDQNKKPIKEVEFTVYSKKDTADKNKIQSLKTNKDGIAEFGPYHLNEVWIKETAIPKDAGYELSDEFAKNNTIHVYMKNDEVFFLGEVSPDTIPFSATNSKTEEAVENNSPEKEKNNINTYLQGLVTDGTPFNSDTNWLVYNDNGVEKLVSKKPIRYGISWNNLYNAGVVFGRKEDAPNPDNYKPQYVNINNKKYVVRLMRAYSDDVPINNRSSNFGQYDKTKGSEWNRLILPLIEDIQDSNREKGGRYGSNSENGVETNMPSLAKYSWWKDFGGNNYGVYRLAQDLGYDGYSGSYKGFRAYRGSYDADIGAAHSISFIPYYDGDNRGWLAVLERVS